MIRNNIFLHRIKALVYINNYSGVADPSYLVNKGVTNPSNSYNSFLYKNCQFIWFVTTNKIILIFVLCRWLNLKLELSHLVGILYLLVLL